MSDEPKPIEAPSVWIRCTCGTDYVYRHCYSFSDPSGMTWAWMRDCKNTRDKPAKAHEPRVWTADGEYDAPVKAAS